MKIAIDARFLGLNSALARYSESVVTALARIDTRNDYIVFVNAALKRRLKLGDNFEVVPVKGSPASFNGMRRLRRLVVREAPDLLHVHFPLAPLFIDCPVLLTVHDVLPFSRDPQQATLRHKPLRWLSTFALYPVSLRQASWIVCVSHATRMALSAMFPDMFHKSMVVRSGVEEAFRGPVAKATRDLVRARLELPPRYLFYSGSARADKNLSALVRVLHRLHERNPAQFAGLHLVLEIYSGGDDLPVVERLARQLKLEEHVHIFKDVGLEERRVMFESATAFCIFSRFEGFGVPVLESQLAFVPVIAADRGALPEVAGERGAVYVDPDRVDETATVIERVLTDEDLRSYLVAHGRKNAMRFEWDETARNLRQIYELIFHPHEALEPEARPGFIPRVVEWFRL